MKRFLGLALLVFGLILSADFIHPAKAQAPPALPTYLGSASRLLFDHSGLDVNGKPETLKDCEFGLTSPIVADLNQQPTPQIQHSGTAPVVSGANSVALASVVAAAQEGQYKLWLRVRDARGNATAWTGGLLVAVDNTPPALPGNIRISVDGTATLEINGDDSPRHVHGEGGEELTLPCGSSSPRSSRSS